MRTPKPRDRTFRTSVGAPIELGDPPPTEPYLRDTETKSPVPGRSQPHPGPACADLGAQSNSGKRFASDDENRRGVDVGSPRDSNLPEKQSAYDRARREARR